MSSRLFILASLLLFGSCSTITKKDCGRDMRAFGLSQGRAGSSKKYTDDIRNKCMGNNPNIDLEAYEKGFSQGWMEYCLPQKGFEMGKRSDRYYSFCPVEREALFREKYLLGKHHFELKDVEFEINSKMEELKPTLNESSSDLDLYTKLQTELEKTKREIQAIEVEGARDTFKFR